MSECSDITKALEELSKKIDNYQKTVEARFAILKNDISKLDGRVTAVESSVKTVNVRLSSLELYISFLLKSGGGKNIRERTNNEDIQRQLRLLKRQMLAVEKYINALDIAGKQINGVLRNFTKIFSIFK
ncbi:hypothetical protein Riv7116_1847 [Rivularia sp. PCC 7116]|uniref:hypothetical protein n=1 Tax=Rivularia sp. PCC 7116 TaxID=373994 RepID=UPI00029EE32A|nr:hypothetical protein [Rivularia sp. PCC 7116]AFY54388.1 hypothetical protein Riv7116_1847 [Rivularia sp. PCC 7116]